MGFQGKPRRSQRQSQPTRRGTLGQTLGNSGQATPRSVSRQRRAPRKATDAFKAPRSVKAPRSAAGKAAAQLPVIMENRLLNAANYDLPAPPERQEYAAQQLPAGFIPRKVGETVGAVVNGIHDLGTVLEVRLLGKRGLQAFVDGDTVEAKYVLQLPSGVVVIKNAADTYLPPATGKDIADHAINVEARRLKLEQGQELKKQRTEESAKHPADAGLAKKVSFDISKNKVDDIGDIEDIVANTSPDKGTAPEIKKTPSPISLAAAGQDGKGAHGGLPPPPVKAAQAVKAKVPSMQMLKKELMGFGAANVELNDINMKELRKLHHTYKTGGAVFYVSV